MSTGDAAIAGAALERPFPKAIGGVRNARLQMLRGLAALSVALYHASILMEQTGRAVFHPVFDGRFGLYGVAVFFAISGYLMANLAQSGQAWTFLIHRIIRIYPAFLLVVGLAFALSRIAGTPFTFDPLGLTLIPAGTRSYPLGVEWTLVFEIAFYVLVFLIIVARLQRHIPIIALAWIGAILLAEGWAPPQENGILLAPYWLLLSPTNLAFAGGLLVPTLLRRGFAPVLGLAICVAVATYEALAGPVIERWLGALLATGVAAWAADEGHRARWPLLGRALNKLGDWSYALYLWHVPAILTVYKIWPHHDLGAGAWLTALAFALAGAALIGPVDVHLYHRLKSVVAASALRRLRLAGIAFLTAFVAISGSTSYTAFRETREAERAERTLAAIGAQALVDPAFAASRIEEAGLGLPPTVNGVLEQVDRLPTGHLAVRGWALDHADPAQRIRLIASCGGTRATPAFVSRRWRRDIAQSIGRPEFANQRIGFTLVLPPTKDCRAGVPIFVLAFDPQGRAGVVPGIVTVPSGEN